MREKTSENFISERDIDIVNKFYKKRMSKSEIAAATGLSRQTIAAIIQKMIDKNVVEFQINSPFHLNTILSEKLSSLGDIKKAIVVQDPDNDIQKQRKTICAVVSQWLSENVRPHETIGIGWGQIVSELSTNYNGDEKKGALLIPLLGGFAKFNPRIQVDEVIRSLAEKMKADYLTLYAPIFTSTYESREFILQSKNVSSVIDYWDHLDYAVFSILDLRLPNSSTSTDYETLTYENRKLLLNKGAVGNICWRYHDINGNSVWDDSLNLFPISISPDNLRKTKMKIGMVNGPERAESVIGAMRGKLIDLLITDAPTAEKIINIYEKEERS